MTMQFFVINLGCKVNRVESDTFAAQCLAAGLVRTSLETADLIIVNTCAVTSEAEKKTRKTVRHACAQNTHACIVVTGCSAALHENVYKSMSERITVVDKVQASEFLNSFFQEHMLVNKTALPLGVLDSVSGGTADTLAPCILPIGEGFRTRVGIKVQDGCNNECTFCVVHIARGKATSRSVQEIMQAVQACVAQGVKEVVLTGINLGSYHQTYQGETVDLARLLTLLLQVTKMGKSDAHGNNSGAPVLRFRIGSIEPLDVTDELIEVIANANGRICRHLHLPLQSGSNSVLAEMNRPYTANDFLNLVTKLRRNMPHISLSTDIIVGFPGETESDFSATCSVARACCFSKIHVFPYSKRQGTPAALRSDQVEDSIKTKRAAQLRELGQTLAKQDREHRAGTTEWALVEASGRAMTESYYSVECNAAFVPGMLVPYTFKSPDKTLSARA